MIDLHFICVSFCIFYNSSVIHLINKYCWIMFFEQMIQGGTHRSYAGISFAVIIWCARELIISQFKNTASLTATYCRVRPLKLRFFGHLENRGPHSSILPCSTTLTPLFCRSLYETANSLPCYGRAGRSAVRPVDLPFFSQYGRSNYSTRCVQKARKIKSVLAFLHR